MKHNDPATGTGAKSTEAELILESLNAVVEENERLIDVLKNCFSPILRQLPSSDLPDPEFVIADSTAPLIQRLIGIRNAVNRNNIRILDLVEAKAI